MAEVQENESDEEQDSQLERETQDLYEEYSMYNELQATLATIGQNDDPEHSASPDAFERASQNAQVAIMECLNRHDCEFSQNIEPVDVEQIIKTYLFDTGKKNNFHPIDFNTFLDNRADVVNIKCKSAFAAPIHSVEKRKNKFVTSFPLSLLIEDVLNIDTNGTMFEELIHFGQSFRYVMIYGHVRPTNGVARRRKLGQQQDENNRKYIIDDGTGSIVINYSHQTAKYSNVLDSIETVRQDYLAARRHGIPFLEKDFSPKTALCKKMLKNVDILMKRIERSSTISQRQFQAGTKAFVVGVPYKPFAHNKNNIWATEMFEDKELDRTNEINFKRKLIDSYNGQLLCHSFYGQ